MATVSAIFGALGFIVLVVGLAMLLPIPIFRSRRGLAAKLAGAGAIAFIVALIITPTPTSQNQQTNAATKAGQQPAKPSPTAAPAAAEKIAPRALTTAQAAALDIIRAATMQVIFCSGEADMAQNAIDKVAAGRGTEMDAYSAAHIAERDCRKASVELAGTEKSPFEDTSWNQIFAGALPACREATGTGIEAMGTAKEVLDGSPSLARAQAYKDKRNAMIGSVVKCKMGLAGLADRAGIPKEQVDFLRT